MKNSTRLIVNTGAQYTRTIVNLTLSLYSTRLILKVLGIDDYGIFSLIGGVVSMLAFITSAMVSTTQRFMSYHQARSNLETQQKIFSNSVIMHIVFGLLILLILEGIGFFLFDGFLNIEYHRIKAAKIVYQCAIFMIICSFLTAPYKALLISHENLVYISVVEIVDGVLKVGIAVVLTFWGQDKLVQYAYLMLAISLFNMLAFFSYDMCKYEECILPKIKFFNKDYVKSMSAFVGWQIYSTGCIVGRTQGTAIILNNFFGTAINAAFGIALQVSGAVNFISSSLVTAINPQLVKAEGAGNRDRMFQLAEIASKFSFLLLAMIVIPICFVLPDLLRVWLGDVPDKSVLFCRVILITALLDQITYGLGMANGAIGNIGPYAMTVNTIKILTLPGLLLLLYLGVEVQYAIWIYAFFELICASCRLPFLHRSGGLNIMDFVKNVFYKLPFPIIFIILSYWGMHCLRMDLFIYIICCIPITTMYLFIIFSTSMNKDEKMICVNIFNNIKKKFHL